MKEQETTKQNDGDGAGQSSFVVNALFLTGVVLACLLIGEIAVRVLIGDQVIIFPRYHDEANYGDYKIRRFRPNSNFRHTSVDGSWAFSINSRGLRDTREFKYRKQNDTLRIVALGDSHTAGFEVRQDRTYAAVLERYLNTKGRAAQVINMGLSGFSTAEETVVLENEAIKYNLDAVVLGFFANDFEDNVKSGLFALEDGVLKETSRTHIPGVSILKFHNEIGVLRWLSENSYLYSVVMNSAWNLAKGLLADKKKADLQTEYAIPVAKLDQYKVDLAARLIERMYEFCKARDIALVILDVPVAAPFGKIRSSVPEELKSVMLKNSDAYIDVQESLGDYENLTDISVPHGHRHMSEFSHLVLGREAGVRLLSILAAK